MIQNVTDLRNALMFDVESDPDIIACEASCEIADYALESTIYEYHAGSIDEAALEAADQAAGTADKKWYEKLKTGIMNFIKAAAQTIRSLLTRLQNFFARVGALNKVKELKERGRRKFGYVKIPANKFAALSKPISKDFGADIVKIVKNARDHDNVIEVNASDYFSIPDKGAEGEAQVDIKTAKGFLNYAAKTLQNLNKSFVKADAIMKELENEENVPSKSLVRRSITTAYNAMSSATRSYFHLASSVANELLKSDKDVDKARAENEKKMNDEFNKAQTDDDANYTEHMDNVAKYSKAANKYGRKPAAKKSK